MKPPDRINTVLQVFPVCLLHLCFYRYVTSNNSRKGTGTKNSTCLHWKTFSINIPGIKGPHPVTQKLHI